MSPTRYNSEVGCGIGPALRQPIRIVWVKILLISEHIENKPHPVNAISQRFPATRFQRRRILVLARGIESFELEVSLLPTLH